MDGILSVRIMKDNFQYEHTSLQVEVVRFMLMLLLPPHYVSQYSQKFCWKSTHCEHEKFLRVNLMSGISCVHTRLLLLQCNGDAEHLFYQ